MNEKIIDYSKFNTFICEIYENFSSNTRKDVKSFFTQLQKGDNRVADTRRKY